MVCRLYSKREKHYYAECDDGTLHDVTNWGRFRLLIDQYLQATGGYLPEHVACEEGFSAVALLPEHDVRINSSLLETEIISAWRRVLRLGYRFLVCLHQNM